MSGNRITIPVGQIEFVEGSDTIWIHNLEGATTLRIKAVGGRIITDKCATSPMSHGDILVKGDIHICLAKDADDAS